MWLRRNFTAIDGKPDNHAAVIQQPSNVGSYSAGRGFVLLI